MANGVVGFLKIDKLKGESQDSENKDGIDVLAWSWGLDNPTNPHVGSGSGSSLAHVHNFSITKQVDISSVEMAQVLLNGQHFKDMTFRLPKMSGDGKVMIYYTIKFEDVVVSSISFGGSGGGGVFTENISFSFVKFKIKYTMQNADGKPGMEKELGWDCAKHKDYN